MKKNILLILIIFMIIFISNCTQPAASTESPDTTPPAAPIITGVTPINTLNPTWTWDISSDVAKVYYQFDTTADEWKIVTDMKIKSHSETVVADDTYVLYVKSQDAAGNFSKINSFAIIVDRTNVGVSIESDLSVLTNLSTIPITITFSKDVTGFELSDISSDNGTASNLVSVSAKVYTANIIPSKDGVVTVEILSNLVVDNAGNYNTSSNKFVIGYDITGPNVTISSEESPITNKSSFNIEISFTEDVTGFELSDISADNGTVSNLVSQSASLYTVNITTENEGDITVEILSDKVVDSIGNSNLSSNKFIINYDITGANAVISSSELSITNKSPFTVTITFNEDVKDFVMGDVNLVNAAASNFISTSAKVFTADITPTADGDLSVDIPAGVLTDLAGNANTASNIFKITYDGTPPTVEVTTDVVIGAYTNISPIPLTVTFSEVTNFTQDDITVVNATITKFQQGFNEMNYKIEITPTDQGEVSFEILANAVTDTAGNGNIASNKFSAIYDTIPPVVKDKILASDIIVIENADYVLNQLNFIDVDAELYENDITSDYDDASNKIVLTDLAGNVSEIVGVFDGVDATDGLKYAVETLSEVSSDIYMMDGTYDMTPTASSLMVNKAINLYGDYKKTFIDYEGGIDIINVGDISGKATIKDLVVGSSKNMATGITGVGFAVDGNILEVSGLRSLKSGNLLYVKTYNGPETANSPYVMIPNTTYNYSWFQEIDTAGTGWRKSQHNSNNDQQPYLGGNMTAD